ncbi:MAG: hypothetical protein NT027_07550 [Proteobacteria bacterium]|nr:hypothetical protein [Pseudomonadota bacterium]
MKSWKGCRIFGFAIPLIALLSAKGFSSVSCQAFCGTSMYFSDQYIASTTEIPIAAGQGKTQQEAFDNLKKDCQKANAKAKPLRFLNAPAGVQNSLRVTLVPALPIDVCVND